MPRKKQPEKRAYGSGTIFQREDGLWVGRKTVTGMDGKRKPATRYGKSRDDVEAKLEKITDSLAAGLIVGTKEQTTKDFLNVWLTDVVQQNRAPKTYRDYENTTRRYLIPRIGDVPLTALTAQHVQRMLTSVTKEQSASMAARCRRILRAALTIAMRWQLVARNVAMLTEAPKVPHREMRTLQPTEARAFLKAVADNRLEALYVLALATGLRQGELLGLRWGDVDIEQGGLTVRYQLQRVPGVGLRLRELKTEQSRRTLTLPVAARDALRRHRTRQREARLWAGSRWQDTAFIFTTPIGTPLDADNMRREYVALRDAVGMPPVRFHDLRHTFTSLLQGRGGKLLDISRVLGHSQVSTTNNTYAHLFTERYAEIASLMDDALTEDAPNEEAPTGT